MRTLPFPAVAFFLIGSLQAADPSPAATRATADYVPAELSALTQPASSELREMVERFVTDRDDLERFYSVKGSELQRRRLREFYRAWQQRLGAVAFDSLDVEGRIDCTLLRNRLDYELRLLERDESRAAEMTALLPFSEDVAQLQEARRLMEPVKPEVTATALNAMMREIEKARAGLEAGLAKTETSTEKKPASPVAAEATTPISPTKIVAYRAAARVGELRSALDDWFKHYDSYDPNFSWWNREPYKQLGTALDDYRKFLRERMVGIQAGKDEPIIGDPIGREGLMGDLEKEIIAYSPEELIAIAEREFAWCDVELKRAAHDMGFGDDWKAALEKVKQDHVAPGEQPALVRELALEAMNYVQQKNLVTVPPLSADIWLLRMMPPAQQKVAPFFLGGDDILVAYPTESMSQDEKLMSLRANNRHFARAVVFHELVPGHHLQSYYRARVNQHRDLFSTPFWVEGWSLWWEFYLWDLKFTATPEDRMGALFWRAHRCARIIFSLNFHLGKWTPQQCVDFLVDRVGHERASAEGEVRRSFNGSYPPLYQAGYMLGALQLRNLHRQLVESGKMTDREFHDAILTGGPMPIEMVRARLLQEKLPKDFEPAWKWADL
jgi:uncharacterized protein (DUF885 family)